MNAEPAIREFGDPFHQDHARTLTNHIYSLTPFMDGNFVWFHQVYNTCKAMIDPLSAIANGQRNLAAEALALHTRPMIITGPPSTFRASIKAAWRAARSGRW